MSLNVGFFPCIKIPTLYIRAPNHVVHKNPTINKNKESRICQRGIPYGIMANITMGDVKGMIELQKAKLLCG